MTENDETQTRISYSKKLSDYFYPKLNNIDNQNEITEEVDFSGEDISEYNLDVSNGRIDISTTRKLIKYLKSFVEVNIKKLDSKLNAKIDTKLDSDDYIIDSQLSSSSQNPVRNSVVTNSLNNKSNINHIHNISDISSLSSTLSEKASTTSLTNHTGNTSNPHGVTLSQLGLNDSQWDTTPLTQSVLSASNFPYCRKYGKIVVMDFIVETYKKFAKNTVVFTLKTQYRPNHNYYGFGYKVGTGDCFTYSLETNGNLKFGTDIANGTHIRIQAVYFTS